MTVLRIKSLALAVILGLATTNSHKAGSDAYFISKDVAEKRINVASRGLTYCVAPVPAMVTASVLIDSLPEYLKDKNLIFLVSVALSYAGVSELIYQSSSALFNKFFERYTPEYTYEWAQQELAAIKANPGSSADKAQSVRVVLLACAEFLAQEIKNDSNARTKLFNAALLEDVQALEKEADALVQAKKPKNA